MNSFIDDLSERLGRISDDESLRSLYEWIWDHQGEVGETAALINRALSLTGDYALQPDLPVISNGSRSGLLVLAANPGWKPDRNPLEDAYCRTSPDSYVDMMFNFFHRHPIVVGVHVRWWYGPMAFLSLLRDASQRLGAPQKGPRRWQSAHASRLLGGWELFPWHSTKDGLSSFVKSEPWLRQFFLQSARTALRFKPEILLIASKSGWELVRRELLPDLDWEDFKLGSRVGAQISYAHVGGGSEVIAISKQIFSAAPRDFTNEELFSRIREIRADQGL